ncbi:MAG TPA: sugar ABC transporter permease [Tepidisphaeraceae bacterium]|jgi:multiple sugar transport system permease protein|nr:sugar ABC transporter permease [Tepidisphaeraceae bacterium]
MTHRRSQNLVGYLFMLPYGAVFLTFIVLPFVVSLVLSFLEYDLTSRHPATFIGFRNFREALFEDRFFWKAVGATFQYVALMIPAQLVLAMLLALGMNAMTRGKQTVRALLFMPGLLSIAVTAILWQWFYNEEFGLFNHLLKLVHLPGVPWLSNLHVAMPSVVLMTLWWTVGGSAAVLLTGLQQIPAQITEAAALDGANGWRGFWMITLPMLKPVLLFMVVMNTIGGFQMFTQSLLLTTGGPEMATRGVVQLIYDTAFGDFRLGYGAAISWLLFIMIAGFSFLQFRIIRRFSE